MSSISEPSLGQVNRASGLAHLATLEMEANA
jgi:hypothetical protein